MSNCSVTLSFVNCCPQIVINNAAGAFATIDIPSTTKGDFVLSHGLGFSPSDVDIKMQSNGLIRFQPGIMWDADSVYLNASDDDLIGTLVIQL